MDKCKYCYLCDAKPCYECNMCRGGDDHFRPAPELPKATKKCHTCGTPTAEMITTQTTPNHVEREVPLCEDCKEILLEVLEDE